MSFCARFIFEKTRAAAAPFLALAALGLALAGCSGLSAISDSLHAVPNALAQVPALPAPVFSLSGSPAGDLLRQGDALRAKGDLDGAAATYAGAVAADPKSLAAETRLGETEMARNRNDAAFVAYSAGQALAPKDPEVAFRLGELQLLRGNAAEALKQFNLALDTRKDDPKLYNAAGVAYSLSGRYDLARENYERGLGVAPDDPALRNNYGLMQLSTGDFEGALKTLSSLVQSPQATDRYRINLALVYTALGKTDEAEKAAGGLIDEAALKQALAIYYRPRPQEAAQGKDTAARPKLKKATETAEAVPDAGLPGIHFTGNGGNGGPSSWAASRPGNPVADLPPAMPATN